MVKFIITTGRENLIKEENINFDFSKDYMSPSKVGVDLKGPKTLLVAPSQYKRINLVKKKYKNADSDNNKRRHLSWCLLSGSQLDSKSQGHVSESKHRWNRHE